MKVFYTVFLFFMAGNLFGQVAINSDGNLCDSSAILDVKSTSRGLLIPRMTASERDAIVRPANGLLIFCTDNDRLYVNQGKPGNKSWVMIGNDEALQDSLNDRYRKSDTSVVLLSRQRAAIEYEPVITQGAATQYLDGNKHWAVLSTTVVPEDSVRLYFTPERVRNTRLTGLSIANDTVQAADNIISGIGKLQGQINSKQNALTTGSVTAGSNKITLTGSPANSIIGPGFSIDVVPLNIDHNALLHYDATQHFFQKTIDTVNTALSGLVKATTGKLSAIADHSSNWDAGYAYRLTSATGVAPLTLTLASNGLTGSMPSASASANGYLKSTDWTAFNSKQNALTTGSVTAGSNKITLTGSPANSIIGPGFSIDVVPVNIDHNALLHYDATQHFFQKTIDTVNTALSGLVKATTGKLSAIADNSTNWDDGYAYRLTSATGTAPLTLTLASNILTGSMPPASASVNGYLKSTDWSTFNGKESVLTFNSPLNRAGNIISLPAASGGQNGYLSGSDYARLHGTSGSILFYDGNGIQQDNSNCYFDNSTNRMGIGTSNPQATFAVGASSQFQVASDGHCTVTGAFGSISPLTGINTTGTGVTGTGTVYGVYGQSTIPAGERAGGYFYTSSSAYARVGGFKQSSPGIFEAYLIWGIGKLVTQNKSPDGLMADLYAPVCPETVITDYGSGQLKNGKCHIEIDPLITKRIYVSREYPVKVFIQLEEDCKGVYVTNKSAEGFDVVELMGGTSDANFSWSFTANISDVTSPDGEVESKNIGVRSTEYITKNTLK